MIDGFYRQVRGIGLPLVSSVVPPRFLHVKSLPGYNENCGRRFLPFAFFTMFSFGCSKLVEPHSVVMQHVSGSLVALSTPNSTATARWYEEKLGFHLVKEGQMGKGLRFALLRYDDNILELIQNPNARPLVEVVPSIKDPFEIHGIFKIGFTVRNFDDVFADLKLRGVKVEFNITQRNDLRLRAFGIRDLDGNLIQFFGR